MFRRIGIIALTTYREAIRNRILYSTIFFAFLLVGLSAVLATATIGDEVKIIKDFGLGTISVFGVAIAVTIGVNLLIKEMGKKTLYNILSKPIARWEFLVGKYCGLLATLAVVTGIMGMGLILFLIPFEQRVDFSLVRALYMIFVELAVVVAVALFFSSLVVTNVLSGFLTVAIFVAGRSLEHLKFFFTQESPLPTALFSSLYQILPHLNRLYIADSVVHGEPLPTGYLLWGSLYALTYSGVTLTLAAAIFSRREL